MKGWQNVAKRLGSAL